MADALNPQTLKALRKRLGWSQARLALESKISKVQISRWERGEVENIRPHSREQLTKALRVKWEALTRAPQPKDFALGPQRSEWRGSIRNSARTLLPYVQERYGISEEDIIDFAPLAFLILAERSLQARQTALAEIMQSLKAVTDEANRRLPYLCGAFCDHYDQDRMIETERKLLRERRVLEPHDCEENNEEYGWLMWGDSPFAWFLIEELKALGLSQNPIVINYQSEMAAPDYTMTMEYLADELGLDATDKADQHIVRLIQNGDIDFLQAKQKKGEAIEKDYRCWLTDQQTQVDQENDRRFIELFDTGKDNSDVVD